MAGVADKNAFKAGLFIVATVALFFAILWLVSGRTVAGGTERTVVFNLQADVAGLAPGSEVRLGGKNVGEVLNVEFDDDYNRVLVKIALPDDVPLKNGATAQVQSTLTGITWINVNQLGDGADLPKDEPIVGTSGALNELLAALGEAVPELKSAIEDIRQQTLPAATETLAGILDAANSVTMIIGDETMNDDLRQTLANLRQTSEAMPQLIDDSQKLVTSATAAVDSVRSTVEETGSTLSSVLVKADDAATDVKAAASGAAGAVAEVSSLIRRNRPQLGLIIDRLANTGRTLELASAEIRRSPWRLLYQPSGGQRESLDLYDAARRFAEGANALQDAAVALEGVADDPQADEQAVRDVLDRVRARFDEYEEAERVLFERIRE